MASLALLVAVIFLAVILSGPVSLAAGLLGLRRFSVFAGIFSILSGLFWCLVAPFPVSMIGALSMFLGAFAIRKF